jgi:hypothetical protein
VSWSGNLAVAELSSAQQVVAGVKSGQECEIWRRKPREKSILLAFVILRSWEQAGGVWKCREHVQCSCGVLRNLDFLTGDGKPQEASGQILMEKKL